ncbi:MAG: DUF6851 domain-containing protein [Xenococcaceae cyanobacterium]
MIVSGENYHPLTSDFVPSLEIEPDTQLVTVNDLSPTISVLWDRAVQQAIIDTAVGPTIASRAYAMVHTAMFDAWAAYDPEAIATRLGDDLQRPQVEITKANKEEAMSFAAYRVLSQLFPEQINIFDQLMGELGFDSDNTTTDITTAAGIGNVSAEALIEFRLKDGANQAGDDPNGTLGIPYSDITNYKPVNPPGDAWEIDRWTPEPIPIDAEPGEEINLQNCLTPHWGNIIPFALESGNQFRPEAPEPFLLVEGEVNLELKTITLKNTGEVLPITPDLIGEVINPEFILQAERIIDVSANLTDEQKLTAEFWEDGAGTSFPPGTWMSFGQFVSARDDHSLDEDAQLFFALGNAVFDAGIATWEAKTYYDYARPVRTVRELGELGLIGEFNPELGGFAIEAWAGAEQGTQTILATDFLTYQTPGSDPSPPFAEYTSGHSAFSAAGAEILQLFTGSDRFGASVTFEPGQSRFEPGFTPQTTVTLNWDSFSEAADEAGLSRIYGGIHFDDGDLNGRKLGKDVAQAVWKESQYFIQGGEQPHRTDIPIQGTTGDDFFNAADDGDLFDGNGNILFTKAGNDVIDASSARVGNNCLLAGAGDDRVLASKGDTVLGNNGDDLLISAAGNDNIILGGDGNDTFWLARSDNNILIGGEGKDSFWIDGGNVPHKINIIHDLELTEDIIGIHSPQGITSEDDLNFKQIGADTVISYNDIDLILVRGVDSNDLATEGLFSFR